MRSRVDIAGFCLNASDVFGRCSCVSERLRNEHCKTRLIVAWSCSSVTSVDEDRVLCLGVSFRLSVSST